MYDLRKYMFAGYICTKCVCVCVGGGGPREQCFFPITFIVHNQKSNVGGGGGERGNDGAWPPIITPLHTRLGTAANRCHIFES